MVSGLAVLKLEMGNFDPWVQGFTHDVFVGARSCSTEDTDGQSGTGRELD